MPGPTTPKSSAETTAVATPVRAGSTLFVGRRGTVHSRCWAVRPDGVELLLPPGTPRGTLAWGRDPATSRALAWMLLLYASGVEQIADDWYESFAAEVVARFPRNAFSLPAQDVTWWLEATAAVR